MNADKTVKVIFSLYDFGSYTNADGKHVKRPHARDLINLVKYKNYKWIPQTISDSIWILYEFETTKEKQAFIADRPKQFEKANIIEMEQWDIDHWTDFDNHDKSECLLCH